MLLLHGRSNSARPFLAMLHPVTLRHRIRIRKFPRPAAKTFGLIRRPRSFSGDF
jgi:hypothetical protein